MNKILLELANFEGTLDRFILDHINRRQREAYTVIKEKPGCSTSVVAIALGLSGSQANNLLRQLIRLKLVEREFKQGVWRYRVRKQEVFDAVF